MWSSSSLSAVSFIIWVAKTPNGPSGGFLSRLGAAFRSAVNRTMTPEEMAQAPEFAFRRLEIDTTQAQAQACLVFTRTLDVSGKTHYEDYLESRAGRPASSCGALDQRLCIGGLDFNQTYNATLKTGCRQPPAKSSARQRRFRSSCATSLRWYDLSGGIILPRDNADGVPVSNRQYRCSSWKSCGSAIVFFRRSKAAWSIRTTMYSWDATQLKNNQGTLVWSGTMDVANTKNDSIVTLIPIRDILKDKKPGAYVLLASDAAKAASGDSSSNSDDSGHARRTMGDRS